METQEYDPLESLDVLDNAVGHLNVPRQTHMQLSQEVQRLRQWCEDHKETPETTEES